MVEQAVPTSADRRLGAPAGGRTASLLERVPDVLATYLTFVATFCAVTAIVPALQQSLDWLRTAIALVSIDAPPSLATAAFLSILASAVRRRMRAAWWFVVAAVVLDRVLGGFSLIVLTDAPVELRVDTDIVAIVVGLVILAILIAARGRFTARTERGNWLRALGLYLALMATGTLIGWGLLELFPGTLQESSDRFGWALTYVVAGLGDPDLTGVDGTAPAALTFLLGLYGAVAVLITAYYFFRPRRDRRRLLPEDEQRVRTLLARPGDADSLGYFATRRDKAAVFSASGKSAVTFRVVSAVSLAGGDPSMLSAVTPGSA
jgi:lysyl-tRNA synthetase class 2